MKSHNELRGMLSALAGGDLSDADRALVQLHLLECPDCRSELAQLQVVVQAVRDLPEAEPPDWLTGRIMARVREEAAPQRTWLTRLLVPLPLGALALVMICVGAWYVMRDVMPQVSQQPAAPGESTPVGNAAKDPSPYAPPPATRQPLQSPPSSTTPGSVPSPSSQAAGREVGKPAAATPAAAPTAPAVADRAEHSERAKAASEAASPAPAPVTAEPAAGARVQSAERKMASKRKAENSATQLDSVGSPALRLRLSVEDRDLVAAKLPGILQQSGGTLVDSRPGFAAVRVKSARLPELLTQLELLGRVTERPVWEPGRAGVIELSIVW